MLSLPVSERVIVEVHDIQGRRLWSEDRVRPPGVWRLDWPGTRGDGVSAAAGVYYAKVRVGERTFTRKLAKVK